MKSIQVDAILDNRMPALTGRIEEYLRDGKTLITTQDEALFRSYGVYTQRPAVAGFFMLRIPVPGGELDSNQLMTISELADHYSRGFADITVRQSIQLHWIRLADLPRLLERLGEAGLFIGQARSDSTRNIVDCPVSGVDEDELIDTSQIVRRVNAFFADSLEFSDLPRKFKIAITGCARHCVFPEINDIGIFAVPDYERGGAVYRARVGGGLSVSPRFGRDLGILADQNEVVDLCAAIALVLKEDSSADGGHAGTPHFVIHETDINRFVEKVELRMGRKLRRESASGLAFVNEPDRSHVGIHGQQTSGLYYIGISTLAGRISAAQLGHLAAIASEYGSGRVRTANTQDVVLLDIPEWHLESVCRELQLAGLDYQPSATRRSVIACSGIEFCKLAVAETKARAAKLCEYLENEVDLDEPVRISITGCPNSCGQHHISDIGLEGSTVTIDGVKLESFQVILGGGVGKIETFGRRIGVRIRSEDLTESIGRLLSAFKERRFQGESFQEFCIRHSDDELIALLNPRKWTLKSGVHKAALVESADQTVLSSLNSDLFNSV